MRRLLGLAFGIALWAVGGAPALAAELADAAMNRDWPAVGALLAQGAEVDEAQPDGTTALHWAIVHENAALAQRLIEAGANVALANRTGATPIQLAAIAGHADLLGLVLTAGMDANAPLTEHGDTALMLAARNGGTAAIDLLLTRGADIDATEQWSGTTALMWAIAEHNVEAARLLIDRGANVHIRSKIVPVSSKRFGEANVPQDAGPDTEPQGYANGGFTALHFAAREGELEIVQALLAAGADIDAIAADGKNALGLAIYNGSYDVATHLIDAGADIDRADAEGFTPLFWAVDRRNMEWNPGFPWTQTADPLPLARKLLAAGADPDAYIDNVPESRRNFGGSPRIRFSTALMRAAYSGDVELVQLLLDFGADPHIRNSDNGTALLAASGYGWVDGYSQGRSNEERLATLELLVANGADVNWACDDGITPLMVAANFGDTAMIQYLVDQGADLAARDLGKKNDGVFGGSIEPLMPIDYAIGVGTFRPNNAILHMAEATVLLRRLMDERGIVHSTSECTLRAFSCGPIDPQGSLPYEIAIAREIQLGNQVDGITGGLRADLDDEAGAND